MAWLVRIVLDETTDRDLLAARLWECGTSGLAEIQTGAGPELLAGFTDERAARAAVERLGRGAGAEPVDDSAWPTPAPQRISVGDRSITLEVGHAFGHGNHPTTRLARAAIERLAAGDPEGTTGFRSLLDVGTGTGILAIVAALRGCSPVMGIDVDPRALDVASRNVEASGLPITVAATPVEAIAARFDIVVVNMLVADLAPIARAVTDRVGGALYVTGFVSDRTDQVMAMFDSLEPRRIDHGDDDWGGAEFARRSWR